MEILTRKQADEQAQEAGVRGERENGKVKRLIEAVKILRTKYPEADAVTLNFPISKEDAQVLPGLQDIKYLGYNDLRAKKGQSLRKAGIASRAIGYDEEKRSRFTKVQFYLKG